MGAKALLTSKLDLSAAAPNACHAAPAANSAAGGANPTSADSAGELEAARAEQPERLAPCANPAATSPAAANGAAPPAAGFGEPGGLTRLPAAESREGPEPPSAPLRLALGVSPAVRAAPHPRARALALG